MPELDIKGKKVVLDDEYYLVNQEDWDHQVAKAIAEQLGIPDLSQEQIDIVDFIRNYYHKYEAFPILNNVCKRVDQPKQCMNNEFINPMKAWKIAGLPKMDGIHFVTVDGGQHYRLEIFPG